jgi:hypothetical protein
MLVTPEIAVFWLNKNIAHNRPIRPNAMSMLMGAIKRNEWHVTHQGVAFSTSGKLLDGQHRLWSIVETGIGVTMQVTFNLDESSFVAIDRGSKRSIANALMLDKWYGEIYNRIARIYVNNSQATPDVVAKFVTAFESEATILRASTTETRKHLSTATMKSAAILRMAEDPDDTNRIVDMYRNLVQLNVKELPVVGGSILRLSQESGLGNTDEVLAKAYRGFWRRSVNTNKIIVRDVPAVLREIRGVISRQLESVGESFPVREQISGEE